MEEKLSAACQMFLVPTTILFAALAAGITEQLKTLLCSIGLATCVLWLYRMLGWEHLPHLDKLTVVALASVFVLAWAIALPVHAYNWWRQPTSRGNVYIAAVKRAISILRRLWPRTVAPASTPNIASMTGEPKEDSMPWSPGPREQRRRTSATMGPRWTSYGRPSSSKQSASCQRPSRFRLTRWSVPRCSWRQSTS